MILTDKRLLIAGASSRRSVAFTVAERAQLMGARVVLADKEQIRELTEHAAAGLPDEAPVVDLELAPGSSDGLLEAIRAEIGWLDGIYFPMSGPGASGPEAFSELASSVEPVLGSPERDFEAGGSSLVALSTGNGSNGTGSEPSFGVPGIGETIRDLARRMGRGGHRVNLVSAVPTDIEPESDSRPVADVVCFLFSDLSRSMTGGTVHADRGRHIAGAGSPAESLL